MKGNFGLGVYKILLTCPGWPLTLRVMIFTQGQLQYLAELPSAVAHALPEAANIDAG